MKVKELYIKKYHQFEDFKLDLTYPEGHEKAGQPLDKVCFIGQSGTGKTSLLEIIDSFILSRMYYPLEKSLYSISNDKEQTSTWHQQKGFNLDFEGVIKLNDFISNPYKHETDVKHLYLEETTEIENHHFRPTFIFKSIEGKVYYESPMNPYFELIRQLYPIIISHPADINFKEFDTTNIIDTPIEKLRKIDASILSFSYLWAEINKKLISYREKEISERVSMSEKIQSSLSDKEKIIEAVEHFEEWQKVNINPIIGLAELLDKILNKFNLQVRTKLDFQRTEDISTIKIETLQGEEISNAFLSTGTKQYILTALPLYSSKPKNAVILFDEPERSLYPDIQKEIVDIYTSLTTDCQFFYATHSPIIASSFEPWEIVELKFKDGKVYQELYYEGERHVDNYTINPQYLRWDDILQRVFDLDSEGNEKRVKALMKLATLESKLKKQNLSPKERENLWNEYLKLSKLTGWTTRITDEKN